MKKLVILVMTLALALALSGGAAFADEIPQPEGGRKFESNWALENALATIDYEEEGYRVFIKIQTPEESEETWWEYNCYYVADQDALHSITSAKTVFSIQADDSISPAFDTPAYDGFDEEGMSAVFTINEKGCLVWNDPHENAGKGLEFVNIGRFAGYWKNEAEEVDVEILWNGYEEELFYNVWITRGAMDADTYASFLMVGNYVPETGRLECSGTCTVFTKNAEGEYDSSEDGETYDAFFSMQEDGRLLFETDNGIELTYCMDGESDG